MHALRIRISGWFVSLLVRLYRGSIVAEYRGVKVVDPRKESERTPWFQKVVVRALEVIESSDPPRFSRVQRHIEWIVNLTLSHEGANYDKNTKTCCIDWRESSDGAAGDTGQLNIDAIRVAHVLVHEATHGRIASVVRNLGSIDLRLREEMICRKEEERFLGKVRRRYPEAESVAVPEIDAAWYRSYYARGWRKNFLRQMKRMLGRSFRRKRMPDQEE